MDIHFFTCPVCQGELIDEVCKDCGDMRHAFNKTIIEHYGDEPYYRFDCECSCFGRKLSEFESMDYETSTATAICPECKKVVERGAERNWRYGLPTE